MVDGKIVEGGVTAQTVQTMKNLEAQLAIGRCLDVRRGQDDVLPHRHGELRRSSTRRMPQAFGIHRPARSTVARGVASPAAWPSRSRPGRTSPAVTVAMASDATAGRCCRGRSRRTVHRRPPTSTITTPCGASPNAIPRALFEFLILEGAQAGLSWSTILRKMRPTGGVRRFRLRAWLPRTATPMSSGCWPTRASCAIAAKVAAAIANARAWLELDDPVELPLELHRRGTAAERLAGDGAGCRPRPTSRGR